MPFRKLFPVIAGVLGLICLPVCASTSVIAAVNRAVATTQTLPPARIQSTLADYQRWLDQLAERNAVAGLATAVVVNDKVVFERTVGYADAATQQPVTADTVFRLASLSKAFAILRSLSAGTNSQERGCVISRASSGEAHSSCIRTPARRAG